MVKRVKPVSAAVQKIQYQLPKRYKVLSILGEGTHARVLKCVDTKRNCNVAVKIPKLKCDSDEESVLEKLMSNNLGKYHIVRCYESFRTERGRAMVFELLDISLHKYLLRNRRKLMPLRDIRDIVKQIAIALNALKDIKLIHCDIKPDNIMLVDHKRRPLQVKLIDFGLAVPTEKVRIGAKMQHPALRCPEIILGLPFSEAIDIWSLGCVMAILMTGYILFPARNEYEAMQFIVELLGLPAAHLLERGKYTQKHFIKTESGEWQFKNPSEYRHYAPARRYGDFLSLDELAKMRGNMEDKTKVEEWEQSIDLLKAMLEMDPSKRITPSEILNHPFINAPAGNHGMVKRVKPVSAAVQKIQYQLPKRYKVLSILGEGTHARVLKCVDTKRNCDVAVKIPKLKCDSDEVSVLEKLMSNNLGKYHIVQYYESFRTESGSAMVFELLDISLHKYLLRNRRKLMPLRDIRDIVKQIAIALNALKDIKLIHCDIKPDNIMLVDHKRRPLQVKLIDFGLAVPTEKVRIGAKMQHPALRCPEIILGLPFSEAIDIWSLGCVMAILMTGYILFPARNEYEAMQFIVELLGLPAAHLLERGKYTQKHFIKTESGEWQFKNPSEYRHYAPARRYGDILSLDELAKMRGNMEDKTEVEEWEQSIDLLKAMLEMDPSKRITPSEILNHPFINPPAGNHGSSCSQMREKEKQADLVLESISDSSDCEPSVTAPKDDGVTNIQSVSRSPLPSAALPRVKVIEVKSAAPKNTTTLDEQESDISLQVHKNSTREKSKKPPATAWSEAVTQNQTDQRSPALTHQAGLNEVSESSVEVIEIQEGASMSEDANPGEARPAKKKRKTIGQRIVSWVRRNFGTKRVSPIVDEGRENS